MKKNILIIKLVFSTLFLFAQDTHEDLILKLYEQKKFSACQSLIDRLSSDSRNNEDFMYLNAKCSQELFLDDAITLYEDLKSKHKLKDNQIAYIGDDLIDLSVMKKVGFPIAVANANDKVKNLSVYTTRSFGGQGAFREAL